jgi:SAM-dependent methyltransferase
VIYDAEVSRQIMKHLGYYNSDIDLVKENIPLFEGVANPFHFVKIKKGGSVLDPGCGVGVDAMIAKYYAGEEGIVIGVGGNIDEITLAQEIAKKHQIDVRFKVGDVEAPI